MCMAQFVVKNCAIDDALISLAVPCDKMMNLEIIEIVLHFPPCLFLSSATVLFVVLVSGVRLRDNLRQTVHNVLSVGE